MRRRHPNILIAGTPGTGKSTLASVVSENTSLEWINVGDVAKANDLYLGYDDEFACPILDEDKVVTELEDKVAEGGKIVEYHSCDFFPEQWFDIIFVLTTNNTLLYDRLARRGYSGKKLEKNIECEIFHSILDEAKNAYDPKIIHELVSNTPEDMEKNADEISQWVEMFINDHANG